MKTNFHKTQKLQNIISSYKYIQKLLQKGKKILIINTDNTRDTIQKTTVSTKLNTLTSSNYHIRVNVYIVRERKT